MFAPIPPPPQGAAARRAASDGRPVVDGYALPASVGEIFAAGRQNDVVTMTGANADENGASPRPTATLQSFAAQAKQRYGDDAAAFLKLYPAATDDEAKVAANTSARDIARVGMYLWAQQRAKTARTPVYTYYWTHTLPGPDVGQYGAFHTSEVPYLLNTLSMSPRPFTALDHRIADLFSTYIVNFATSGDPNGGGLPRWDAVSATAPATMEIGDERRPSAADDQSAGVRVPAPGCDRGSGRVRPIAAAYTPHIPNQPDRSTRPVISQEQDHARTHHLGCGDRCARPGRVEFARRTTGPGGARARRAAGRRDAHTAHVLPAELHRLGAADATGDGAGRLHANLQRHATCPAGTSAARTITAARRTSSCSTG